MVLHTCHRIEKDAKNGPGMSLIGEKYRRLIIIEIKHRGRTTAEAAR
jgi:hypothetical protein